jgi:hypothetical protein
VTAVYHICSAANALRLVLLVVFDVLSAHNAAGCLVAAASKRGLVCKHNAAVGGLCALQCEVVVRLQLPYCRMSVLDWD